MAAEISSFGIMGDCMFNSQMGRIKRTIIVLIYLVAPESLCGVCDVSHILEEAVKYSLNLIHIQF